MEPIQDSSTRPCASPSQHHPRITAAIERAEHSKRSVLELSDSDEPWRIEIQSDGRSFRLEMHLTYPEMRLTVGSVTKERAVELLGALVLADGKSPKLSAKGILALDRLVREGNDLRSAHLGEKSGQLYLEELDDSQATGWDFAVIATALGWAEKEEQRRIVSEMLTIETGPVAMAELARYPQSGVIAIAEELAEKQLHRLAFALGNALEVRGFQFPTLSPRVAAALLHHIAGTMETEGESFWTAGTRDERVAKVCRVLEHTSIPHGVPLPELAMAILPHLNDLADEGADAASELLPGHTISWNELAKGCSPDAARTLIAADYRTGLHLIRHVEVFSKEDRPSVMTMLAQHPKIFLVRDGRFPPEFRPYVDHCAVARQMHEPGTLRQALPYLRGLPLEFAERLVAADMGRHVLKHLDSFSLSEAEVSAFVRPLLHALGPAHVLPALDEAVLAQLKPLEDEFHFAAFREQIGCGGAATYERFLELRNTGRPRDTAAFARQIQSYKQLALSDQPIPEETLADSVYQEVADSVYPDHSGELSDAAEFIGYEDRSDDLELFVVPPPRDLEIAEASRMVLKPRERRDPSVSARMERLLAGVIEGVAAESRLRGDLPEGYAILHPRIPADAELPVEEKLLMAATLAARGEVSLTSLKRAVIGHHFASDPGIADYVRGTRDQAAASRSPDYNHLLHLREFFFDKMHDTVCSIQAACSERSLRIMAEDDPRDAWESLRTPNDRLEKIAALASSGPRVKERLAAAISLEQKLLVGRLRPYGMNEEPAALHLLDASALQVPQAADRLALVQGVAIETLGSLFKEEVRLIDRELGKFTPEEGGQRPPASLEIVYSKNQASARMRRTAGVCVAGEMAMWNEENYLQCMIVDPVRGRCEGGCLLHYFEEQGKRILTASFNPTSTLLYKVNQRAMFRALLDSVTAFAEENEIDLVCSSKNQTIRTNRTGGEFEAALDEQIRAVRETFTFEEAVRFSEGYAMTECDVLWKRKPHGRGK